MEITRQYGTSILRVNSEASVSVGEYALDRDTGNVFFRTSTGWLLQTDSSMTVFLASTALVNGTPVVVSLAGAHMPATVWVVPVSGDTVLVEYSMDGGVTYENWPNGSVTARSKDALVSGATHLRFSRTVGSGTTSRYGVS